MSLISGLVRIVRVRDGRAAGWARGVLAVLLVAGAGALFPALAETGSDAFRRGDYETAARRFEAAARAGDRVAQNNLGVMYLRGRGVAKDYGRARELFLASAEQGLEGAKFNLGIMALRGYGGPVNHAEALRWFRASAEGGDREAQFFLGLMYFKGQGVDADRVQARGWFLHAAEGGLPAAQFNLAMLLLDGREPGGPRDAQARRWLEAAAAQDHEGARLQLAKLDLTAVDDSESTARALASLRELAHAGEPEAQMHYGLMLVFGHGGTSDPEEGRFWLRQSALQGYTPAQFNLGTIYAQGIGTETDLARAYAWLALGADSNEAAGDALRAVEERIADDERTRALEVLADLRARARDAAAP